MSLLLLASLVTTCFFWLVIRDQWIHERVLVAGRFDQGESMRILFALLALVALSERWSRGQIIHAFTRSAKYKDTLGGVGYIDANLARTLLLNGEI